MPRLALIHALPDSLAPLDAALDRRWPEATRMHLLDSSLSRDLADSPTGLDARFDRRFLALAEYALATGAEALLFSCSAFGRCIDRVAARHPDTPVLKPYDGMLADATDLPGPVGIVATFAPTLSSLRRELPATTTWMTAMAPRALEALQAGEVAHHDLAITEAAAGLVQAGCRAIALAQFSMARAASVVAAHCRVPVLTAPDSAVRALRARLDQSSPVQASA